MSKNKTEKVKKEKPVLTEAEIKINRNKKTKIAISCFVLLLAVGITGNWYWENSDLSSKVSTISNAKEKILGEATFVDATTEPATENEYFSSARVDRQKARDESLEKLQKIIDSANQSDEAKKQATKSVEKISNSINLENKIETLVTAKGINNCLAIINTDTGKIDIIVDAPELTDTVILQIKEIAVNQLNCSFEDVTIIQSK